MVPALLATYGCKEDLMQRLFVGSEIERALRAGPLGTHVDDFVGELASIGYAPKTIRVKVLVLAMIGRWLRRRGLGAHDLSGERAPNFLGWYRRLYRAYGPPRHDEARTTFLQLLSFLRGAGIPRRIRPTGAWPNDNAATILERYAKYLREERGLAPKTLIRNLPLVDRFLTNRFRGRAVRVAALKPDDITSFVLRRARSASASEARHDVIALRSFLRFLFLLGEIPTDLTPSLPAVPNRRQATIPKFISPRDVRRLLGSCRARQTDGGRDYAVLVLLARLGLRAGEIVAMTLDDIDWSAGELLVHGKGRRHDRVPLPVDVGEALAGYIRDGRPRCDSRRVFLCLNAPRRGLTQSAVTMLVKCAIERAGLRTPTKGAHLLRHSLATDLLRRGASLKEVGELLRHRHFDTTSLYAKVDLRSLRHVAAPWPVHAS
jgi:site-specific recombinase XerD